MNSPEPEVKQITMRVSVPRDQVEAFKATMRQWMLRVPPSTFWTFVPSATSRPIYPPARL